MRLPIALALLAATLAGGCGGSSPSAASVVRAWSQALNSGDNDGAADLFAPNAKIVQSGTVTTLANHHDAVAWNAGLPCSGKIVRISTHANVATATFVLGDRKTSRCDGPGQRATAIFRVRKGKIVLWHQTPNPTAPAGPSV